MRGSVFGRWAMAIAGVATFSCASAAQARRVVYLNADPTTLVDTDGQDPASNSFSAGGFTPGPISGWPTLTDAQKDLLVFLMKEASYPFDIVFTWERPASGSYDMLVMGTEADSMSLFEGSSCSAPVSLADCEDAQGENVSFLFYGCMSAEHQADLRRVAHTALKALGFGWGLENVSVTGEVMGSYSGTALRFGNECVPVSGTSQCFHQGCPAGQQRSDTDLMAYIGARVDDGPPEVEITAPAHLSVVSSDFVVEAAVEDLFGGLEVSLEIVEAEQHLIDAEPPYRWTLSSVPAGTWTLRVHVVDADDNEASDEVVVCIGTDACDPDEPAGEETGTGGSDDDFETGDGTGEPDSGGGGGGGGLDPTHGGSGPGAAPAGSGCHCRGGDSAPWPGVLALLLIGLARQRGRDSATRAG
jgi:hypothetical protein